MTDSGRSTSDRSGWVAYMKRRAGSWITSAEQLAERVGITRECVTNQLITKCHLSSELFSSSSFVVRGINPSRRCITAYQIPTQTPKNTEKRQSISGPNHK